MWQGFEQAFYSIINPCVLKKLILKLKSVGEETALFGSLFQSFTTLLLKKFFLASRLALVLWSFIEYLLSSHSFVAGVWCQDQFSLFGAWLCISQLDHHLFFCPRGWVWRYDLDMKDLSGLGLLWLNSSNCLKRVEMVMFALSDCRNCQMT